MRLEKIKNTAPKVPELVMQAIIKAIHEGKIRVNEGLLPERELAAALGVGRGSLRECLAILEFLRIIENRGNRKVVIKPAESIENTISLLRFSDKADDMPDFMEFRKTVECAIVELACERATPEDLAAMRKCLDRMQEDLSDVAADVEFHLALANASHNYMFIETLYLINNKIWGLRFRFFAKPMYHQKTFKAHKAIYDAVANGQKRAGRDAMLAHLDTIGRYSEEEDILEEEDTLDNLA